MDRGNKSNVVDVATHPPVLGHCSRRTDWQNDKVDKKGMS